LLYLPRSRADAQQQLQLGPAFPLTLQSWPVKLSVRLHVEDALHSHKLGVGERERSDLAGGLIGDAHTMSSRNVGSLFHSLIHYLIALPIKIIVGIVTLIEALSWLPLQLFKNWSAVLDIENLGPYVGFQNGFTPISSWHNFWLYLLAMALSLAVMLPFYLFYFVREYLLEDPNKKLWNRLMFGNCLSFLEDTATAFGTIIIVLVVFDALVPPFGIWLKGAILVSIGLILGNDSMRYSEEGRK
jgi:hypothetical protein